MKKDGFRSLEDFGSLEHQKEYVAVNTLRLPSNEPPKIW